MDNESLVKIEVAYAIPEKSWLIELQVPTGTSVEEAIVQSGLLEQCPDIDLAVQKTGIFGKIQKPDAPVKEGDRIEVYRPLKIDPKEARRLRAKKNRA